MEGYELRVDGFTRITEPWDTHFLKTSSALPAKESSISPFIPIVSPRVSKEIPYRRRRDQTAEAGVYSQSPGRQRFLLADVFSLNDCEKPEHPNFETFELALACLSETL